MSINGHAHFRIVWLTRLSGYPVIKNSLQWSIIRGIDPHRHSLSPIALQNTILARGAQYSTASLVQELQSLNKSGIGLSDGSTSWRLSASAGQQESTVSAVEPVIRQVNTTRIGKRKDARSQAEKLTVYQRGKAFRNQMLKDRGSWSYDWRIPLQDLERCYVPDGGQDAVSLSIPEASRKTKVPHNLRADQIKPPTIWTISTFYTHVVQLTSSNVDRLVARQIYSKGESHTVAVAGALASLFADPSLKYVVSVDAGNVALGFLFDNGKFARGQDLFGQLQELQKDTDPSTYNIMLGAAAEQKDLHTFTYILKMMIIYRVSPSTQTWLHLARAVREDEVRTIIINRMGEKGLLKNSAIVKEAVALLMPQLVVKYLDSGNKAHDLIHALDSRYGPAWCSTPAAESLIDGVGVRHTTEEALMTLKKLCDRGYRPTQGMLLLFLRQCSWSKAHELAVQLLFLFRTKYTIKPSMQIYDVLFQQAWRSQLYNCCRVLWIYACVHGHTSFDMQRLVKGSLYVRRRTSSSEQSRSSVWEETAGKVITGHGRQNNNTGFRALMSLWKPAETSRDLRDRFLRTVRSILDDDLAAVGHYQIREPLDELLRVALRMDRQWARGRVLKDVPIDCKYTQLIHVELIPNPSSKVADDNSHIEPSRIGEESTDSVRCCWMSEEIRSRPCICPGNRKSQSGTIPNIDSNEQEVTAEAISSTCE
ncbi:MAG: hypothetical protein Q9199_003269 [Rusavskia elegans]